MIKVQVSITPNEAKRLIAKAVSQMTVVRAALENGKILLKGGTTVSAIAEELASVKLGISGRITQQGTKTATSVASFHLVMLESGQVKAVDSDVNLEEIAVQMGKNDILIVGANALDVNRKTAMMGAHPVGGIAARVIPAIMTRGVTTIIAVGWEKLIPCSIEEALVAAGRETIDMAMGSAVGLIPLFGTVITETDAISMLTRVKATMIGAGGITGGEGSSTFVIEGEPSQVEAAWEIVSSVKGAEVSGLPQTLDECVAGSPRCAHYVTIGGRRLALHRGCVYLEPKLLHKVFSVT